MRASRLTGGAAVEEEQAEYVKGVDARAPVRAVAGLGLFGLRGEA